MSLPHALLGVLDARPMSGYDLARFFDAATGWVWAAPHSQIYPTLRKMEQRGLIRGDDEVRGPRLTRTVYSLTEEGKAELAGWVATAHPLPVIRDPFLLQALHFDLIDANQAHDVLTKFIEEQEQLAEEAEEHRDKLLNKDSELLKERLSSRGPAEHERIARLKAHVFDGIAGMARYKISWARQGQALLLE